MYRNLKLGTKILIAFLTIALVSAGVTAYFAFTMSKTALEEDSFNKLTVVREMKGGQIEDYFQQITDQVITFSNDRMIINAMQSFDEDFDNIDDDLAVSSEEKANFDDELLTYYEEEFLERLIPNLLQDVSAEAYWPEQDNTRILQYLYTASNPAETGSKDFLDDAGDGSGYSTTHALFHPIVRDYLERFGYYDIFLVDLDGHIVYSVFKEVDYGTSLLTGPYSETNFADAFKAALEAEDTAFSHLVDFEPYQPSYDAPASFIASPIFEGAEKIGVLVFQMPIDRINAVMTNNEKWSDVGLGESGETYLIGEDFTLRNQSRFLIEDSENYFRAIEDVGTPLPILNKIKNLGTSIGLQQVETPGVEAALAGETGTAIFPDYRNVPVLSAYKSLAIPGVNWAIMSEIDEAEAFGPVNALRIQIIAFLTAATAVIAVAAYLFSRSITQPLKELTATADELATGNLDAEVSGKDQGDEFGSLACSFDSMRLSMKDLIGDLKDMNRNLEDKVVERTAKLERATERVRTIIENASDAIITIDSDQNIILFNPGAENTFGYTQEEVVGRPLTMLMLERSRAIHKHEVEKFRNEPVMSRSMDVRRTVDGLRKDGTTFPAEAGISKMVLDGEVFFTAFLRDITERVSAQEQLKLQAAALNAAANGIAITDAEGVMRWVNPAFTSLTGYSSEDAVGHNTRVLKSGKHDAAFYKGMWDTIKSGQVWLGEVVNQRKDGSLYTEEMTITPVPNEDDEIVHFVAIKQDITERKRMETELAQANDRMSLELNFAREIQIGMLPLLFPAFPDYDEFTVFAQLLPAREVGGDWYDFYFIDEDLICFCIGDVSGKGAPAALFMAVAKTLIKSRIMEDKSTASTITYLNDELSAANKSFMFATVFIGILNFKTGELLYTNAAHNPALVKSLDGSVTHLDSRHGLVVGPLRDSTYTEEKITLNEGDIFLLYTDGITEAMDPKQELFSEERLTTLFASEEYESTEELVHGLISAVKEFEAGSEQADDITVLAIQYFGEDRTVDEILELTIKNEIEEIGRVYRQFAQFAAAHQLDDRTANAIQIVFEELLSNIILYGGGHDIAMKVKIEAEQVSATIVDDGIAFNPFDAPEPDTTQALEDREVGGLGVHIVLTMMDEVTYDRVGDKNVVFVRKSRMEDE